MGYLMELATMLLFLMYKVLTFVLNRRRINAILELEEEDTLTKENIVESMPDIRRVLLEAVVSLPVVRRFVQVVSEQALFEE
ncbi:hypothetical protein GQ457_06G010160 [Hibiscus cannabinus]